ncbi:hypothetical protein [Streptomyces milbemycinicus]
MEKTTGRGSAAGDTSALADVARALPDARVGDLAVRAPVRASGR